jgi:hypothetical protein
MVVTGWSRTVEIGVYTGVLVIRVITARPDASASAWLCHKGPIARLVSHIGMLQEHTEMQR